MTNKQKHPKGEEQSDIALQGQVGLDCDSHLPEVFVSWQSKGAEGYIALGTMFLGIIEGGKNPSLVQQLLDIGEEEQEQIKSHARAIFDEGTNSAIQREIRKKSTELWIEASERGIDGVLRSYKEATNRDIASLFEKSEEHRLSVNKDIEVLKNEIKKSNSFMSQVKSGVVGGIALGLLLFFLGLIDNPLAALFSKN